MIILLFLSLNSFAEQWTTYDFHPSSWARKDHCEQLGKAECFEVSPHPTVFDKKIVNGQKKLVLNTDKLTTYSQAQAIEQDKQLRLIEIHKELRSKKVDDVYQGLKNKGYTKEEIEAALK